jgi:hypothetical protein
MSDDASFAKIAFKGNRFSGGHLPLEVVGDLSTYREIIVGIAKSLWKEKNPERKRLPKGFDSLLSLALTDVSEGSAVAHIERERLVEPLPFPDAEYADLFDESQNLFIEGIVAANENGTLARIPGDLFHKVGKMGKRLRAGEVIEFAPHGNWDSSVSFSNKTKENLSSLLHIDFEKTFEGFGIVTGSEERSSQVFVLSEIGAVKYEVEGGLIRQRFDGRIGEIVEFSFDALVDSKRHLKRFLKGHYIELIDDGPDVGRITERIGKFVSMSSGWLDGEGEKISRQASQTALDVIRFLNASYDGIAVYPMLEGGIQIEFETEDWSAELAFSSEGPVELVVASLLDEKDFFNQYEDLNSVLLSDLMNLNGVFSQ